MDPGARHAGRHGQARPQPLAAGDRDRFGLRHPHAGGEARIIGRVTPARRGGSGPPLVCLHGFTDTWRTWELVLPALEGRHDVLAPTLPGHAGGRPLPANPGTDGLLDAVEGMMDAAGFATAHIVGNSLGGYLALRLAERGRARSVVAFAPAGGWANGGSGAQAVLDGFAQMHRQLRAAAPHVDALVRTPEGRRQATRLIVSHSDHLPAPLVAHLLLGAAACDAEPLIAAARGEDWHLDAERVTCPVRMVWGTGDLLLPWPAAAAGYRRALPHAEWVELEGVGHCPQLDVPVEAAHLILGFTAR